METQASGGARLLPYRPPVQVATVIAKGLSQAKKQQDRQKRINDQLDPKLRYALHPSPKLHSVNTAPLAVQYHLPIETIHAAQCPRRTFDPEHCANEIHLSLYSHEGLVFPRPRCPRDGACPLSDNPAHMASFLHDPFPSHNNIPLDGMKRTSFAENHQVIINKVRTHFLCGNKIPTAVAKFVSQLRPSHRCHANVFELILGLGHLLSRRRLALLKTNRAYLYDLVLSHPYVREARDRLQCKCQEEQRALTVALVGYIRTTVDYYLGVSDGTLLVVAETTFCKFAGSDQAYEPFARACNMVVSAFLVLGEDRLPGVNNVKDIALGTDVSVFGIIGPHLGVQYGEVVIVLKQQLTHHPDFDMTMSSATAFASSQFLLYKPYMDAGSFAANAALFPVNRMHPVAPGFQEAACMEIMAQMRRFDEGITHADILAWWRSVESHAVFEGHLPGIISLDMVEKVIIPEVTYDALSETAREILSTVLPSGGLVRVSQDALKSTENDLSDQYVETIINHTLAETPPTEEKAGFCFSVYPNPKATAHLPVVLKTPGSLFSIRTRMTDDLLHVVIAAASCGAAPCTCSAVSIVLSPKVISAVNSCTGRLGNPYTIVSAAFDMHPCNVPYIDYYFKCAPDGVVVEIVGATALFYKERPRLFIPLRWPSPDSKISFNATGAVDILDFTLI